MSLYPKNNNIKLGLFRQTLFLQIPPEHAVCRLLRWRGRSRRSDVARCLHSDLVRGLARGEQEGALLNLVVVLHDGAARAAAVHNAIAEAVGRHSELGAQLGPGHHRAVARAVSAAYGEAVDEARASEAGAGGLDGAGFQHAFGSADGDAGEETGGEARFAAAEDAVDILGTGRGHGNV